MKDGCATINAQIERMKSHTPAWHERFTGDVLACGTGGAMLFLAGLWHAIPAGAEVNLGAIVLGAALTAGAVVARNVRVSVPVWMVTVDGKPRGVTSPLEYGRKRGTGLLTHAAVLSAWKCREPQSDVQLVEVGRMIAFVERRSLMSAGMNAFDLC